MMIKINLQSDVPLYTQLTNQIIEGIASGALARGEALPSVRSLSSDLGINMHTVNKAYSALKQEGYVEIHRQKGVVVQNSLPEADDAYYRQLEEKVRPIISESICHNVSEDALLELCRSIFKQIRSSGKAT
ncbi:DNA-binding transcriptional regulator YhcF (GntR family) [Paenibacillus castaneae]|uniref:GntR family transcriptional regulator n=1 Tax=Paenibacillus castaneae TaxID=474957 RepID=UPI000C9BDD0F|nr:GntR family transcriptional regulator [Paenibacillus castaneae]NIK76162.1 DNA-binding transcriptional regulator YhcF (GntR family) [Paenibacillus castaneae]